MHAFILALALAAASLYLTATWSLGRRLRAAPAVGELRTPKLPAFTVLAVAAHGVLLYLGIVGDQGLKLGFFNAASLIAWVAALVLVIGAARRPLDNLGLLVLPLAALLIVPTVIWPDQRPVATRGGLGIDVHVLTSVLAYAVLTVAACQALLLAYQERRLHARRPRGVLHILPPLKVQEELLFQLIAVGFVLLTLSLGTGIAFVADMLAQHLAHKTVLSWLAWLIFGVLLWGRWRHGWRGRTAVGWSLAGFAVLALAYFGAKLVLELIKGTHWYPG
ncbi:MAG: cytochrome c biogenesis protein CcsA [Gammaproteobacteria bacterium]|nr:cytochrome c biogenesis protein CcsA [Gammaproteobacteria bacterium]